MFLRCKTALTDLVATMKGVHQATREAGWRAQLDVYLVALLQQLNDKQMLD
jgi:hypothetical protein